MQLSTKGRYAVMALIELALHAMRNTAQEPLALSSIAAQQEISILYLEQLFAKLKKKNIVSSIRGVTGGYILGRSARDISIADIMEAVGENMHATRCTPGSHQGCMLRRNRCVTHHLWEELGHKIHDFLHSITLADLCEKADIFTVPKEHRKEA